MPPGTDVRAASVTPENPVRHLRKCLVLFLFVTGIGCSDIGIRSADGTLARMQSAGRPGATVGLGHHLRAVATLPCHQLHHTVEEVPMTLTQRPRASSFGWGRRSHLDGTRLKRRRPRVANQFEVTVTSTYSARFMNASQRTSPAPLSANSTIEENSVGAALFSESGSEVLIPEVDVIGTSGGGVRPADDTFQLSAPIRRDAVGLDVAVPELEPDELLDDDRLPVYIQGLFELTQSGRSKSGHAELAAAQLALRHINRDHFIPGYRLVMYVNNTKGDTGVGVDAFFHALYRRPQMVMLLGSASSPVTEQLAQIVSFWNVIQVSFGSTSPALSDRHIFPLFYRTVAPDSSHNPARCAFVRRFGWDTVSILHQDDRAFTLGVDNLVQQLEQSNVSVATTVISAQHNNKERLAQLKVTDCRVIFASFMEELAEEIFCEVYHLEMYGGDYVWILHEDLSTFWWQQRSGDAPASSSTSSRRPRCTQSQLRRALDGALFVHSHNSIVGDGHSISNMTNERFLSEFRQTGEVTSKFVPQTYDAVWSIAWTLREAQREWDSAGSGVALHQFNYNHTAMCADFFRIMEGLSFSGVSGPISFRGADRVGVSSFYQYQGDELKLVALYFPLGDELDFNCTNCTEVFWQGGQIPVARRILHVYVKTIDLTAFLSVTVLAVLGIIMAICFLIFNLYNRRLKYIKLSSPKLNNMAVGGCLMVYLAIILLGIDHKMMLAEHHFPIVCMSRAFLLSAGFSLAFGAMFTKTYRVHQIFIRASSGVVKSQDKRLIILVGALLLIDCFILTLWIFIDPMQRQLRNLTIEISQWERDIKYLPQVEECRSAHIEKWLGALYVYKGLLLAVGVYMAWETRHVKIPVLNDSQYIGLNVYNVVITSVIVVVIANLVERKTLAYVVVAALIFASTTTTLCLLFIPKIHAIWRHPDGDPIVESMGLRIESNTRRFAIDERRELYYRVEVQNRVYRRELCELTQEVGRLEGLLKGEDLELIPVDNEEMRAKNLQTTDSRRNGKKVITSAPGGPGIELLCATTLTQFLLKDETDAARGRRRSLDSSAVGGATISVAGARSRRQQRLTRMQSYLPEIVLSTSGVQDSDFFGAGDDSTQALQPLIDRLHHRKSSPCAQDDGLEVTPEVPVGSDQFSKLASWNCVKRMSLRATSGLRIPAGSAEGILLPIVTSGMLLAQRSRTERGSEPMSSGIDRNSSSILGLMSKAGSESVLHQSSTAGAAPPAGAGDQLSAAAVISRPASQSLILFDFLADTCTCCQSPPSGGAVGADGPEESPNASASNVKCRLQSISCNELRRSGTGASVSAAERGGSFLEVTVTSQVPCSASRLENESSAAQAGVAAPEGESNNLSSNQPTKCQPTNHVTQTLSDLGELRAITDSKRREIETLRSKLSKLEIELETLEEGSSSVFV